MTLFRLVEDLCQQIYSTIVILPSQHPTKREYRRRIARIKAKVSQLRVVPNLIELTLLQDLYDEIWVLNEQVKYQETTPSYTIKMTHCTEKINQVIREITLLLYEKTSHQ